MLSAGLLVLSFPDFNLWPLAWVALVPLLLSVVRGGRPLGAFLLGWGMGTLFFYLSCYWLTHAMIHFGGIPAWLAYPLLLPAPLITGLFPGLWCWLLARVSVRWSAGAALLLAPAAWAATEWARLLITGQLWNAIGYSQAYTPILIQTARWGGVYAVGFLIMSANAALAYLLLRRHARSLVTLAAVAFGLCLVIALSQHGEERETTPSVLVVAVQPNVPVAFGQSAAENAALVERHLSLSTEALRAWENQGQPSGQRPARLVIWPESPMNFTYTRNTSFREVVTRFARERQTSVLFNSLEPARAGGTHNSAVLVNEEGRLVAQYDKIRLLPFGEYVPLPRWLPVSWLLAGIAGDFTPGEKYPLMGVGGGGSAEDELRVGVFICFESAFPSISRTFARQGADVLVNISNDGYLGQTPVMRQHLANAIFRAVETNRTVVRVTNTGISALITPGGLVRDETAGFAPATRTWTIERAHRGASFYANYGDLFSAACALLTLLAAVASTLRLRGGKLRSDS